MIGHAKADHFLHQPTFSSRHTPPDNRAVRLAGPSPFGTYKATWGYNRAPAPVNTTATGAEKHCPLQGPHSGIVRRGGRCGTLRPRRSLCCAANDVRPAAAHTLTQHQCVRCMRSSRGLCSQRRHCTKTNKPWLCCGQAVSEKQSFLQHEMIGDLRRELEIKVCLHTDEIG